MASNIKGFYYDRLLDEAVKQGNAAAQYLLGKDYTKGDRLDYVEAFKWYSKAAEQGYVQAQFELGKCHEQGKGVRQDAEEALEWYSIAAEQGHAEAQETLEKMEIVVFPVTLECDATLEELAEMYSCTLKALQKVNPELSGTEKIKAGTKVNFPL